VSRLVRSWWLLVIPAGVALGAITTCVATFHHLPATENPGAWGTFGDYFGDLLNPLISALTLFVAISVWQLQKKELAETRKAMEDQAKTAEQQRQEQRFFDLLNVLRRVEDSIVFFNRDGNARGNSAIENYLPNSGVEFSLTPRIAFFDDRIEIENPGTLVPGLTVEDMRQGVSKIRNHVLARVFRELNLIEQWGSGVRRIFRKALELGLPEPQIIELGLRVRVVVRLAQALPLTTANTSSTEQVTEQVSAQVMNLFGILMPGPLGTKAVMGELGLAHRPTFIQNYLQPALQAGGIEMTQPQSPNSPTQKYRLPPTGHAYLKNQQQ